MTQTTPKLSLVKPGGGSTGTNTPPDRVDIDVLNDNFDKIDAAVGSPLEQNRQWYGPAASIGTLPVSPKDGDEYQESDGNKILWKRVSGNWVTNEQGMFLVRPTSVSVGTINPDGSVSPIAGNTICNIDGVFTSRFSRYVVRWDVTTAAPMTLSIVRFRRAGVDLVADYQNQKIYFAGTGTPSAAANVTTGIELISANSSIIAGELTLVRPSGNAPKVWFGEGTYYTASAPPNGVGAMVLAGINSGSAANSFDGFSLVIAGTTFISGRLSIYGLA